MSNATLALAAGVSAISAGENEISLAALNESGSDSSAIAVLLAWQRHALEKKSSLHFLDIPASLKSLAHVYGVDVVLNGFEPEYLFPGNPG